MIPFLRRLFPASAPKRPSGIRPPQAASTAAPVTPVRHYFEALNTVDHRTPIPATGLYVHRLLSKFNRLQLASVARYLWDNVGLVYYATDLVANYSTPMIPGRRRSTGSGMKRPTASSMNGWTALTSPGDSISGTCSACLRSTSTRRRGVRSLDRRRRVATDPDAGILADRQTDGGG